MGVEQAVNTAASSSRHWKVPASVDVNVKVAFVLFVGEGGPEVTTVFGAVWSMTQLRLAGDGSVLVAVSVARTSKV
jgi:hypothetical protein